jgi:hypothetical protein
VGKKKKKNKPPRPTGLALFEDGVLRLVTPDGQGTIDYAYKAPTPEQITYFVRHTRSRDIVTQLNALYDLLEDILGEEDYLKIEARLRDRYDALDMQTLFPAVRELVTGQTGFPTQSPSDSSSSERPTGRRSTGRVQPEVSTPAISTPSATQPSSTGGPTTT